MNLIKYLPHGLLATFVLALGLVLWNSNAYAEFSPAFPNERNGICRLYTDINDINTLYDSTIDSIADGKLNLEIVETEVDREKGSGFLELLNHDLNTVVVNIWGSYDEYPPVPTGGRTIAGMWCMYSSPIPIDKGTDS